MKEDLTTGGFEVVKKRGEVKKPDHPTPFSESRGGPRQARGATRGMGRGYYGGRGGEYRSSGAPKEETKE